MRRFLGTGGLVIALSLVGHGSAQAAFVQYTDPTAWATAVAALGLGTATEDFSDATLVTGLSTTNSDGISGGVLNESASTQFNDVGNPALYFSPGTLALGGFFDLSPGGAGDGLIFVVNSSNGPPFTPAGTQVGVVSGTFSGFLGWVSNDGTAITTIRMDAPSTGDESFTIDNLQFASGTTSGGGGGGGTTVPEPGMLAQLGTSAAVLFGMMVRRRKA